MNIVILFLERLCICFKRETFILFDYDGAHQFFISLISAPDQDNEAEMSNSSVPDADQYRASIILEIHSHLSSAMQILILPLPYIFLHLLETDK